MAKRSARVSVYKRQKKGAKERLKVKNAGLSKALEEFRAEKDKWKVKAENLTKEVYSPVILIYCFSRKCSSLTQKINLRCRAQHLLTCTKATTAFNSHMVSMDLPTDVRTLTWFVVQQCIEASCVFLGQGVFGKCYLTQLGPTKVCVKVYRACCYIF